LVNPAVSQPFNHVEASVPDKEATVGHLLKRLPSLAAAATLAMVLAMTLATAISIRSINQSQSDLRLASTLATSSFLESGLTI
jgi:hypothetical protein